MNTTAIILLDSTKNVAKNFEVDYAQLIRKELAKYGFVSYRDMYCTCENKSVNNLIADHVEHAKVGTPELRKCSVCSKTMNPNKERKGQLHHFSENCSRIIVSYEEMRDLPSKVNKISLNLIDDTFVPDINFARGDMNGITIYCHNERAVISHIERILFEKNITIPPAYTPPKKFNWRNVVCTTAFGILAGAAAVVCAYETIL